MKFLKRSRREDARGDVELLADDADPDMQAIEAELQELKSRKTPALPPPEDYDPRQKINHGRDHDRHRHDEEPLDLREPHDEADPERHGKHHRLESDDRHDRHGHGRHRHDRHPNDLHGHDPMVIDHEEHDDHDPHLPRTLQSKLFGIGFSGYFQLAVLCVAVGAVLEAGGVNPFMPGFSLQSAMTGLVNGALNVFGWVFENGVWPLMIGALIVLPLWFVWRLLSVPFRH